MRSAVVSMAVLVAASLASGCGPSAAEVKKAKTAVYACSEDVLLAGIAAVLKERTGGFEVNRGDKLIASDHRWHSANGAMKRKGAAMVGPGDLSVGFVLGYQRRETGWFVRSDIRVGAHVVGSPLGKELTPSDADWPSWAGDKLNTFMVALHKKLKATCTKVTYEAE